MHRIVMTILECPSTIPAAPSGAVTTWNSETKVNTVVSYKCSGKLLAWLQLLHDPYGYKFLIGPVQGCIIRLLTVDALQCTENVVSLAYTNRICI